MCRLGDRGYLYQFVPKKFSYLTKVKKISHKGMNLKTDYLINIMHELVIRYYFTEELSHNVWSSILRRKYGKYYNYYVSYLVEKKFLFMISNYYASKKARTYKININLIDMVRCRVDDNILIKKHKKDFLVRSFTQETDSPINKDLRLKLIDDLYHVDIDYESSLQWLNKEKKDKNIELLKYFKNLTSIDGIDCGHLFYKFDSYGRLHTNFTVLKKHIRNNFIKIDGKEVTEIDIRNSQPYFLAVFLKNELGEDKFNKELDYYVDVVKNGLVYDIFTDKFPDIYKTRDEAKIMVYKVIFGKNIDTKKESKIFREIFPTVYNYLKEYKEISSTYRELSHVLQGLESKFIFDNIVKTVKETYPYIRLFTVHDSVVFPVEYKEEVNLIFRNYLKNLL